MFLRNGILKNSMHSDVFLSLNDSVVETPYLTCIMYKAYKDKIVLWPIVDKKVGKSRSFRRRNRQAGIELDDHSIFPIAFESFLMIF